MIRILKNKEGNAAIQACVIVLCMLLLFTVISEYLRLQMITRGIRDSVQAAVISVAIQNYDDVYNGLREGYSGGYELDDHDQWITRIDEGAVLDSLTSLLNLEAGSKFAGEKLEYTISNLEVSTLNTTFAPENDSNKFEAEVVLDLEIPLSFGWEHLPPLQIKLKVNAGYTPKF